MKRLIYLHVKTKTKNKTRISPQLLKTKNKKEQK